MSERPLEHPWTGYNGYLITKDPDTRWPGSFDWKVEYWNPHPLNMGWFGSIESAQRWIVKQENINNV